MGQRYYKSQVDKGRPPWPREAVKKTAGNNWMHIVCAVWTPEITFNDTESMEGAAGVGLAVTAPSRQDAVCKLCRIVDGGCVSCQDCNATFHVACAHEAGYTFGFDITPVKGSRKDMVQIAKLGEENGHMTAAIWCSEHIVEKGIRHKMTEIVPETGLNALQTFVRTYKQADRTFVSARKPIDFSKAVKHMVSLPAHSREHDGLHSSTDDYNSQCVTCKTGTAALWHSSEKQDSVRANVNGAAPARTSWQCHKCYVRERLEITSTIPKTESEDEVQRVSRQPDYFELTAPRPVPPPLLPSWTPNGSLHGLAQTPSDEATTEQAQQELRATNFTVTNQVGVSYGMSGSIFGRLDDAPLIGWNFFLTHVQDILAYDVTRHAVQTAEGLIVYNSVTLMQALARVLQNQQRDVRWRIVDYTPERPYMAPQLQPPSMLYAPPSSNPRPSLQPPRPLSAYNGAVARPSSSSSIRSYSTMPPMQSQQMLQGMSDMTQSGAMRPTPYFSQSPSAQQQAIPSAFLTGGASPTKTMMQPKRSTTPRDQQHPPQVPSVSGASSSPSLKNLVH